MVWCDFFITILKNIIQQWCSGVLPIREIWESSEACMRQRGLEWESSELLLHLQFFPSLNIGATFHGIPLERYAIIWCLCCTRDFLSELCHFSANTSCYSVLQVGMWHINHVLICLWRNDVRLQKWQVWESICSLLCLLPVWCVLGMSQSWFSLVVYKAAWVTDFPLWEFFQWSIWDTNTHLHLLVTRFSKDWDHCSTTSKDTL